MEIKQLHQRSVTELPKIGEKLAEKLAKLGINSLADFLFHLPLRYEDRSQLIPLAGIRYGHSILVQGEVVSSTIVFGKRRSLQCIIRDNTGSVTLRFFHFNQSQKAQFSAGKIVRCFGEVRAGRNGLEMYHPEYEFVARYDAPLQESLTPVYPLTDGITQKRLRWFIQLVLEKMQPTQQNQQGNTDTLQELLPEAMRQQWHLPDLGTALKTVHQPDLTIDTEALINGEHPCCQRLIMEELAAHQLTRLKAKQWVKDRKAVPIKSGTSAQAEPENKLTEQLLAQLPFSLTGAQQRVLLEIAVDVGTGSPALRLIQGDVGSGKTLVAALSALDVIEHGYQVALLAPTEILASQHYFNFEQWLSSLRLANGEPIKIAWLTGKLTAKQRNETLARIASADAQLIIGTHALFQKDVEYKNLVLVIVDEQHRFGVHQRFQLAEKSLEGFYPHQLVMTATPIPRTLAMSVYGDIDISIIDELPPGRQSIETHVMSQSKRSQIVERIYNACQEGAQAYWVCTLIEGSEQLQAQAATDVYETLKQALPNITVGLVHGRINAKEKQLIMQQFKAGDIDLLVATTVIEVGVDVPNATIIVIDNAERLGLAQLHQLRGRVGRGSKQSYCLLMYENKLSQMAKERLNVMRETSDGFLIAEHDLRLRGPGEILGIRQTGALQFRLADILRDKNLLAPAKHAAEQIFNDSPEYVEPLIQRWIGSNVNYQFI